MSLHTGQTVRMGGGLWRVEYVNECRARVVPLEKSHVVVHDDEGNEIRSFDASRRSVNISPNSPLEVVTNIELAKTQIELEAVEREAVLLRKSMKRRTAEEQELAALEIELAAARAEAAAAPLPSPGGASWKLLSVPETKPGSLKANVVAFLTAHPGATTKQVVIAGATGGAVAACLDRFWKAGVVQKS